MKIDQDIPFSNSKPTTLTSVSKKPLNKKPILIGIGIIVIIAIIALLVMFVLPMVDFTPGVVDDTNDTNTPIVEFDPISYCKAFSIINEPSYPYAIAANTNNTTGQVSLIGSSSNYFMIFDGTNKEFIENPYAEEENNYSKVVTMLKEKNVKAIMLGTPGKDFVLEMKEQGIKCYNSSEIIKYIIGEEKPFDPNDLYCKPLTGLYGKVEGKFAITANENNERSAVSLDDYTAPLILVYENKVLIEAINNPALSGGANALIQLLLDNNIETIIAGTPPEEFASKLQDAEIKCYNSTEVIKYITTGEI